MVWISVNPQAEADAGFDVVKPGVYRMRIEGSANMPAVSEFDSKKTAGNKGLKIRLVFADKSQLYRLDGSPAHNPGSIIDNSVLIYPKDKQGKLRSLVDACGLVWNDFDSNQLVGKELDVQIADEVYNGIQKNVAKRYLKQI